MKIETVLRTHLRKAAKVAENAPYERQKMGCVVFRKKTLLAFGCNQEKSEPLQKVYNKYREDIDDSRPHKCHAEIATLKKIQGQDLTGCSILICRLSRMQDKEFAMARPCPACMEYIRNLGIRDIYYTTDFGFAHERLD